MTTIVLFGGPSDERHVSVASAQNVVRALGAPLAWFWAPGGAVYDVAIDDLLAHQRPFEIDFEPKRPAIWPNLEQALDTLPVEDPVFFLALHGGPGEDGTVQRLMEDRGIAFTGSGSAASAAAFDKTRAKEMLRNRVRMADSRIVRGPETVSEMLQIYERVVLKPVAGGSSRGLYFADRDGDFPIEPNVPYLAEQFIAGRELTVAVVDMGDGPFVLPPIEIQVDRGRSFDYNGKYLDPATREICPARIPDVMRETAEQVALTAHTVLGCDGYSRTDMIAADDDHIYFLELNTLPGLTSSSLVPKELRAAGIDFREFLQKQVDLAHQKSHAVSNSR
ncbi:MAG TPA: ATP-grasp domain-containing protein [Thermoanaerobaculia bacterium]|nr:ATP-grasp domain-containing protein [Thermoanaerobaculia bacterium]